MTREDIIRMAKEAGFVRTKMHGALERFAVIVAAEERQRIHEYLMRLHLDAKGKHNYLHVAANGLEDL